jgi:hypothetical protein
MSGHTTRELTNGNTIISICCTDCEQLKEFTVRTEHYAAWISGTVIQAAMPEIPEDERELLISGMCGTCFDALFSDEDEDEA